MIDIYRDSSTFSEETGPRGSGATIQGRRKYMCQRDLTSYGTLTDTISRNRLAFVFTVPSTDTADAYYGLKLAPPTMTR